MISPTNSFAPLVTVTGVDGATINYEMSPTLSGAQLERAVSRMLAATGAPGESVSCPSGLVGQIGAVALCDVTTAGATVQRTAQVHRVAGLRMDFDLIPVLSRAEVEGCCWTNWPLTAPGGPIRRCARVISRAGTGPAWTVQWSQVRSARTSR